MEQRKRRKKRNDMTQKLITLIIALVVVLVAVVSIALTLGRDGSDPSVNQGNDPTDNNQSGNSTEQPDDPTNATVTPLTILYPEENQLVTLENTLSFAGLADPSAPITINGTDVYALQDGTFRHEVTLQQGSNTIEVTYDGQTTVYTVEYRYATQSVYPETATEYGCGATMKISVMAREGSELEVTFNGKAVKMKKAKDQLGSGVAEGFLLYTGTYQMPTSNDADKDMGVVEYKITCGGVTETYTSGTITCLKSADVLSSDPSVTPNTGDYMNVGSGYIVEILTNSAESFAGSGTGDPSDPRVNYLPAGTVDYGHPYDISNEAKLIRLRCGRRIYSWKTNYPTSNKIDVVDCYKGTLPDHNEVGIASVEQVGGHTLLTFDVLWKAPFYFDLLPQQYANPDNKDYAVTACTATYVDITFCYATKFEGTVTIPADNPVFSHAELTQNEYDCTLRLYLKKTGVFYGWDAYYNENDQLCFVFLNPAKATATTANKYGADLTGVRIMIDVGHGGTDGGAVGNHNGQEVDEAYLNLLLANQLREELESMGATVIMNRTDDSAISVEARIAFLKEQKPDICIAIHQNSIAGYPNISGADVMYFTPFSQLLAKYLYQETQASNVYKKVTLSTYVYYVARETVCPVVLMENGYMTNAAELESMMDEAVLQQKAEAMAHAAAQYFLKINQ